MQGSIETPRGHFPPTRWTLVQDLRDGGTSAERALGELCKIYWLPVYAFIRREGASAADAEDLTQGFFLRLLKSESLHQADAEKGKLRTFLLSSLKRFRIDDYRTNTRQKRGSGAIIIPLDADEFFADEPSESDTPEALFERRWALSLLDEAFERTAEEYRGSGRADLFEMINPFLSGHDSTNPRYAEVATELGISQGAVQVAIYRLRKRYRRQLETVVAETLSEPGHLEEELRHLFEILAS